MSTAPILAEPSTGEQELPPVPGLLLCLPPMSHEALSVTLSTATEALGNRPVKVVSPDSLPQDFSSSALRFQQLTSTLHHSSSWVPAAAEYLNAWEVARQDRPAAIVLLGPEAASVSAGTLRRLAEAAAGGQDLVLPRYPTGPHGALVNSAILYPLSSSLFQQPARFPLPIDVAMSPRMAEKMASAAQRETAAGHGDALLWPVGVAATSGWLIREVDGDPRTLPQPAAEDLNTVLATVAGSLFADIESKASFWQRARLNAHTPPGGIEVAALPEAVSDDREQLSGMIETFRHAYNNLRELWSLVLPPNSLLSLKKLSIAAPDDFLMPDALWARTVYDFLLAYRLRTINRGHLLGAFTPLYLAWVASHLKLVSGNAERAEQHVQAVAAAFQADKPYLVARWRWPDRFNP